MASTGTAPLRRPAVPETREPLVDHIYDQMLHPEEHMAALADTREGVGAWDEAAWCTLMHVARRCSEHMHEERAGVAEVIGVLDTLAGHATAGEGVCSEARVARLSLRAPQLAQQQCHHGRAGGKGEHLVSID